MLLVPSLSLPADAASLTDAVVEAVRLGVQQRELVPDEVYSVYQLADLLGVSRSPVREAMLRLAEVGLVEIARNRGFRVVLPTAHDIEEIFEVRLALEPAAAGAAARARTDVRRQLTAMSDAALADDEPTFWAADRALHHALLTAAGNRRAAAIVEQLRATTALLGPPTTATGRSLPDLLEEHRPIADAVLAGDDAAAEAAMRHHLEHTRDLLTERYSTG